MTFTPASRILIFFVGGIVIPCGFLVYLGIAAIRTESRLKARETAEQFGQTADSLQTQADDTVQTLLQSAVMRPESATAAVELDADGRVLSPYREAPLTRIPLPALEALTRQRIELAERLEFVNGSAEAARSAYLELSKAMASPRWRAAMTLKAAGAGLKGPVRDQAILELQRLTESPERDEEGSPFGLLARVRLSELEPAQAVALGQDLVQDRWKLPWSETVFYMARLQRQIATPSLSDKESAAWEAVQQQWRSRQRRVEEAQRLLQRDWIASQSRLARAGRLGQQTVLRLQKAPDTALLYAPREQPDGTRTVRLLWTPLASILTPLRERLDPIAAAGQVRYRTSFDGDPSGPAVMAAWQGHSLERRVRTMMPALILNIGPQHPLPLGSNPRQRMGFAMIALAAAAILAALYVTHRAVRREMEVAQLKAQFVAGISHELKTPLSIIDVIGQKLDFGRYASETEAREFYGMLREETQRLKVLIDDVLDFSRLMENRKPYPLSRLDLSKVVREAAERFAAARSLARGELSLDLPAEPLEISGNAEALGRVVLNLLDNGYRYSPPDRRRLAIRAARDAGTVLCAVSDEGYGISPSEQPLVFERFYRGASSRQRDGLSGAGLGLAIVRHIVEAHNAKISLESQVDRGSCFTIRFKECP